jgi:2-dehydro-3-deoxyphosphogalactonate aldolase
VQVLRGPVLAVGGMTPDGLAPWRAAGADGFGLGNSLFHPGVTASEAGDVARRFVAALAG